MPPRTAQMVVLLTGFIAFISVLVAGMLAIRLDRTRDVLRERLQACTCCEERLR
jgi:hypothetical protein